MTARNAASINLADYDWCEVFMFACTGRCDSDGCDCCHSKIHAPSADARGKFDDWDGSVVRGTSLCGIGVGLTIPGPISRMGGDRCDHCCELSGMPKGVGSPKNDPECRKKLV